MVVFSVEINKQGNLTLGVARKSLWHSRACPRKKKNKKRERKTPRVLGLHEARETTARNKGGYSLAAIDQEIMGEVRMKIKAFPLSPSKAVNGFLRVTAKLVSEPFGFHLAGDLC